MEGITLVGADESQMVNIPVPSPGETRTLEQTVSFRDCQICLLKVAAQERTEEEKKESGTDADVLLHVSASVTDRSEGQTFTFAQIEREGERFFITLLSVFACGFMAVSRYHIKMALKNRAYMEAHLSTM